MALDVLGNYFRAQEQDRFEKMYSANPQFALGLLQGQSALQNKQLQDQAASQEQRQRDALKKLAPKFRTGGINPAALSEYAGITGDLSPLIQLARENQPTSDIREFQFAQQNPEFAEYMKARGGQKLPAALQIAREMDSLQAIFNDPTQPQEDRKRALDQYNLIGQTAKTYGFDRGVSYNLPSGDQAANVPPVDSYSLDNSEEGIANAMGVSVDDIRAAQSDVANVAPVITPEPAQISSISGYDDLMAQREAEKVAATEAEKTKAELTRQQATFEQEGRQNLPFSERNLKSVLDKDAFLKQTISNVRDRVNGMTTGWKGSLLSAIPETEAYDLKADVDTLLANAGFDRLQEMRDSSPTGSALGAVTERELALLQASAQNLQNSQSPEQFRRNLTLFEQQREASTKRIREAYEKDYKRYGGNLDPNLTPPDAMKAFEVKYTRDNPARPKTQAEVDALPSGSYYIDDHLMVKE